MVATGRSLAPLLAVLAAALGALGVPPGSRAGAPHGRLVDLTHAFSSQTIYWPTARTFELHNVAQGRTEAGFYYTANDFCAAEHGGTHLDAPAHFAEAGPTVDHVPLDRLMGPAAVIDISAAAAADRDYRIAVGDLTGWERLHGRIPAGAIVLLRTDFARFWPDPIRYLGTSARGREAVKSLRFPGLHPDAARWLVTERSVDAVGIDTASIDYGQSSRFETHRILARHRVPILENVANLERLPARGATIIALPMKIAGGSGGPLRIIAVLEEANPR